MARKRDYGQLLEKFTDGRRRPALSRGRRGTIDPAVLLPPLAELLEIDRQAEAEAARSVATPPIGVLDRPCHAPSDEPSS